MCGDGSDQRKGCVKMGKVFCVQDRENAFGFVLSAARECERIVALVQVGSGAAGYRDDRSDLDFVIALDSDGSMPEVMDYMHRKIDEKYGVLYFRQDEERHLQCYVLSDLLEIDIGYGGYENAAARKPAFRVLYDKTGTVEEKMIRSREWMDDRIYGGKRKKDIASARETGWIHLMHAAVAIHRGDAFRAVGEMEYVRKLYIDLLGDRYRLESGLNREIDRLPEEEKEAIRSTFVTGEDTESLWTSLLNLTRLVYRELEGQSVPVTEEMLLVYCRDLRGGDGRDL